MQRKGIRKVKIYKKLRVTGMRFCDPDPRAAPCLNVSGDWLQQTGFGIGDRIELTVAKKEMMVDSVDKDPAMKGY